MGDINFDMFKPWLVAAAILLIGFIIIKCLNKITAKALKRTSFDPAWHKFINNGISGVCWVILIGSVLSYVGVPIPTFITVLGVAGAALALSLKESLGNIVGGMMSIVSKPFKNGDFIEIEDVSGKVDHIDWLFTRLVTLDNKIIHIPNGKLSTSIIVNYSEEGKRRVDCKFGINSASSIIGAKNVLSALAQQSELILLEPAPIIGIAEQANGIIFWDMKVWCATDDYWEVKYFLEENVRIAFYEAGIELAIPRMNVHMKK